MKSLLTMVLILALAAGSLLAAGAAEETAAAEPQKEYTIRLSVVGGSEQVATKAFMVFKEELEKTTDGQIKVDVFHSASLFNAAQQLPAIMRGNLEMANASPATMAEYAPYMSMFTAGYLFTDYNHMSSVLNGEIGKEFYDKVANEIGIRPLTTFYLGARQINLRSEKGVKTPADLKGVKLRMPGTEAYMFLGKALGATPTPMAFGEIYMALNAGTVDGQDNPLPTVQSAKFYEVTKSISITNHYISVTNPMISESLWQELGPELQGKVTAAIEKAREFNDNEILRKEAELLEFFRAEGLNIVEADLEAFSSHVREAYMENTKMISAWDMDLYNQIINMK